MSGQPWFSLLNRIGLEQLAGIAVGSTLLCACCLILMRVVRSRSASMQSGVWQATCIAIVSTAFVLFAVPGVPLKTEIAAISKQINSAEVRSSENFVPLKATVEMHHQSQTVFPDVAAEVDPIYKPISNPTPRAEATRSYANDIANGRSVEPVDTVTSSRLLTPLPALLAAAWIAVLLYLLIAFARSIAVCRSVIATASRELPENVNAATEFVCKRLGLRECPQLVLADEFRVPFTAGVFRPVIVLPTAAIEWSIDKLSMVIAHEMAHVERRDVFWHWIGRLAICVAWFNPLVWFAAKRGFLDRERACDDRVIGAGFDKIRYSQCLVEVAAAISGRMVPTAAAVSMTEPPLKQRLQWILSPTADRSRETTRLRGLLIASFSCLALILGTIRPLATAPAAVSVNPAQQSNTTENTAATDQDLKHVAPTLRGEGKNRQMLLKGHVIDIDGEPARNFQLSVRLKQQSGTAKLPAEIESNEFESWIPIGDDESLHLELSATTTDTGRRATQGIQIRDLRQGAIDGVILQLADADRIVSVLVTEKKKPVAGAHVVADASGQFLVEGVTNDEGYVFFRLLEAEKLSQITAWTDNHLIGGYAFYRKPRRDPHGTTHTIELEECRDQTIRFLDAEDDSPVANIAFQLIIGTGPPNYNFPAVPDTFPNLHMVTNRDGEAVCRWFPDCEKHGAYVEITDPEWAKALHGDDGLETAADGALLMKLKPRVQRKPLIGKVTSEHTDVGGLLVEIQSFQGEEEGFGDHVYAFTDTDGSFTANCIPGATYCVCVDDAQFTSNIIDLIPYELDTGKSNTANLTVSVGEPVEILVTSGPAHRPMANQRVYIRWLHHYTWYEDGERKSGTRGRAGGVHTDNRGVARAHALADSELEVSVNAGEWRSDERKVKVKAGEVTRIDIHRKIDVERAVTGQLVPPTNNTVDVANAQIIFGSIDGETDEEETITTDATGQFAFSTQALQIGIFAYTADGKAAGVVKPESLAEPVELHLKPTADLHGQLLGRNDEPLANHAVRVTPVVRGKNDLNKSFFAGFNTKVFETRTDDQGHYSLRNLPTEFAMTLRADSLHGSNDEMHLDSFDLKAGVSRPPLVSRLDQQSERDTRSLAEKYDAVLRDSKLGDYHLLVMVFDSASDDFVGRNLMDHERTKEVMSFMHLRIRENDTADEQARQFVASKNWPQPERGIVFACALDGTGKELGRVQLDARTDNVQLQAAEFLQKHAPPQADARAKWDAAFVEAKRSGRRVWVRVSQRYCAPCFQLSRWLDDNRTLLEKDYVFLKIDNVRDTHGDEVAKRIIGDREHFGVPFYTIFDANEQRLIDSEGPTGNIGHPSSYEGRLHLKEMLSRTQKNLTDAQIEQIIATLE